MTLEKIISGGQTGADRGGLDAALARGFPCGGWCPRDRRAEDGRIPERYPLKEAMSRSYTVRTRLNVEQSDGTLIICHGAVTGGSLLTRNIAVGLGKPCLVIDSAKRSVPIAAVLKWVMENSITILNVAGSRESKCPGIQEATAQSVGEIIDLSNPGQEQS